MLNRDALTAAEVIATRIRVRRTLAFWMRDARQTARRRGAPDSFRGLRGQLAVAAMKRGPEAMAGGLADFRPVRPDRMRREARILGAWAAEPIRPSYCGREDAEGDAKNAAADLARTLRLAARMLEIGAVVPFRLEGPPPVHCPACDRERGVAIPAAGTCPHATT